MERVDANLVPFAQNNSSGYRFAFGTDTATDDINANYNDNIKKGWGTTPNEFPEVEDFNAMVYTIGYLLSYLYHMGIAEWNDKQKYRQYSRVIGSDGIIYKAKTGTDISPNIDNNPTSDTTNWEIDNQFNINSLDNKTTPADTDNFVIQETGGLLKKLSWTNLKIALATLFALKDSPSFTGTPTAPTQIAQDNSTKVATTAYVDGKMVLGTVINATGTSIDFTGIPSWVKRITITLSAVSTNGTSSPLLRVGTSGGIVSTGYTSDTVAVTGSTVSGSNATIGVSLVPLNHAPSYLYGGDIVLELLSNNTWVITGILNIYTVAVCTCASKITLGTNLDRIRLTTVNGTDSFDAGQINIIYEG